MSASRAANAKSPDGDEAETFGSVGAGEESSIVAPISVTDVAAAMKAWQSKLGRFGIVYAYREEFQRKAYYAADHSMRRVGLRDFGFDNDRMRMFESTVSVGSQASEVRPPIRYLDDRMYVKWWPHLRLAHEMDVPRALKRGEYFLRQCEWLEAIGFFPQKGHCRVDDEFFLPEAMARAEYVVRPELEEVDGAPCYVLERPGVDQLWLDPAKGFALRRRAWRPKSASTVGYSSLNFRCWSFRELLPGVWLPWMTRREYLAIDGQGKLSTMLVGHTIVGQIYSDVDVRRPDYLPGTIVVEVDGKTTNTAAALPGGENLLDEVADRTFVDRRSAVDHRLRTWSIVGIGGAAGFVAGGVLVHGRRLKKRH